MLTSQPFTVAMARRRGVSPGQLRGPGFQRLFQGIYLPSAVPRTPGVLARAALLPHPDGARVSHHTAARLRRLPVPHDPDEHVSVCRSSDRRPRTGLRSYTNPGPATLHHGIPASTAAQIFVEMSGLSLVDLIVLGDAMLRKGAASVVGLRRAVSEARAASRRGGHRLARAVELVRAGVDSPMETRLRLLLVMAGLPEPVVNHEVRSGDGDLVARFDLFYPDAGVLVEYDGRQHAEDVRQWNVDIQRREWLDRSGLRLVVVNAEGIYRQPSTTLHRVASTLRDRGIAAGIRRADWRRHFPEP